MERSLFDSDPDTCAGRHLGNAQSVAAHEATRPRKESARQRILAYIASQGLAGATCEEVELQLGIRHQTAGARLSDLKRDGAVVETGRTRKTTSGCPAAVLVAREVVGDDLAGVGD